MKCCSHDCKVWWHAFTECECLGTCNVQCVTECVWAQSSHLLAKQEARRPNESMGLPFIVWPSACFNHDPRSAIFWGT